MKKTGLFLKKYLYDCYIGLIITLILLTSWVFQISHIPTGSMAKTLLPGDIVIVNKLKYHLNEIRLPWINTKIPLFDSGDISWNEPKDGDIVAFVAPGSDTYYVKRLVAKEGDKLFLKNKNLYVSFKDKETIKKLNNDKVKSINFKGDIYFENPYKKYVDTIFYKDIIKNDLAKEDENKKIILTDLKKYFQYRFKENFKNTDMKEQIKTLKDDEVKKIEEYFKLIEYGKIFFKDQNPIELQKDEFFMMGDNRDNSYDSRFFGIVKRDRIQGSPLFKLFSVHSDNWSQDERWVRIERFFSNIKSNAFN
jgi:signal peptidase I